MGSLMPVGQGREYLAHGKDVGEECFLGWVLCGRIPLAWCVWIGEGSLRPGWVGGHLSWPDFVSGESDSFLLQVLPYLALLAGL